MAVASGPHSSLVGDGMVERVTTAMRTVVDELRCNLVKGIENRESEFTKRISNIAGLAQRVAALEARGDVEGALDLEEASMWHSTELNTEILAEADAVANNVGSDRKALVRRLNSDLKEAKLAVLQGRQAWEMTARLLMDDLDGAVAVLSAIDAEERDMMAVMESTLHAADEVTQKARQQRAAILSTTVGLTACLAASLRLRRDEVQHAKTFQRDCNVYANNMATLTKHRQTATDQEVQYTQAITVVEAILAAHDRLDTLLDTASESIKIACIEEPGDRLHPVDTSSSCQYETTLLKLSHDLIGAVIPRKYQAVEVAEAEVDKRTALLGATPKRINTRSKVAEWKREDQVIRDRESLRQAELDLASERWHFNTWVAESCYESTRGRLVSMSHMSDASIGPCALSARCRATSCESTSVFMEDNAHLECKVATQC